MESKSLQKDVRGVEIKVYQNGYSYTGIIGTRPMTDMDDQEPERMQDTESPEPRRQGRNVAEPHLIIVGHRVEN